MCLTAKNLGLQEENINISNPQGKSTRDGIPQKEREGEGEREKERERPRKNHL